MAEREKLDIPEGRFPSNSYSSIKPIKKAAKEEEAVTPIASGVKPKKKSFGERLADAFINTDGKTLKNYLIFDVLVPGLKKSFEDVIHMMLYGSKQSGRVVRTRGESRVRRVPIGGYNSIYNSDDDMLGTKVRAPYEDLIFPSREMAEKAQQMMAQRIAESGFATLKYYNSICGRETDFTQTGWGWYSMTGSSVYPVRDGFVLKMPRLEEV